MVFKFMQLVTTPSFKLLSIQFTTIGCSRSCYGSDPIVGRSASTPCSTPPIINDISRLAIPVTYTKHTFSLTHTRTQFRSTHIYMYHNPIVDTMTLYMHTEHLLHIDHQAPKQAHTTPTAFFLPYSHPHLFSHSFFFKHAYI